MSNIAKWIAGAQAYSAGNLADNTAMASRANNYFNTCQVSAADVVIDNATNKDLFMMVTILLGSWTPVATDILELYLLPSTDGTNYDTGSSSYLPTPDHLWQVLQLSTDTTGAAKQVTAIAQIPPTKFKMLWHWLATNSSASSGNSMSWLTFNTDLNG